MIGQGSHDPGAGTSRQDLALLRGSTPLLRKSPYDLRYTSSQTPPTQGFGRDFPHSENTKLNLLVLGELGFAMLGERAWLFRHVFS